MFKGFVLIAFGVGFSKLRRESISTNCVDYSVLFLGRCYRDACFLLLRVLGPLLFVTKKHKRFLLPAV